jgi:hypothetical protein
MANWQNVSTEGDNLLLTESSVPISTESGVDLAVDDNWALINNGQTPTWANVNSSQTPGWTPINL